MVFNIDHTDNSGNKSNYIVNKLIESIGISPYYVTNSKLDERKAQITFLNHKIQLEIKVEEGSIFRGITKDVEKISSDFELPKESKVQFYDQRKFHEFLYQSIRHQESKFPEKVKAQINYNELPFGVLHTLPINILKHLAEFEISSDKYAKNKNSISWSSENDLEKNKIKLSYPFFHPKKDSGLHQLLINTGFIRKVQDETNTGKRIEFFLKEGETMDYKKLFVLEKLLESTNHNDHFYDFRGNYVFSGEIEAKALAGIPNLFDCFYIEARIICPEFEIQRSMFKEGILVETKNLETAAKISNFFDDKTKISFIKN